MFDMMSNSAFVDAMNAMRSNKLPDNAFKNVGKNPDGSDMMVVSANFKFAIEKGKRTEIEVSNPDVARVLYDIQNAGRAQGEIDKFIARKLYELSTYDDIIKRMNFDSAIELACSVFGMSKDWASKRLRVGKYFIDENYHFIPVIPASWTISHVQELLQHLPKKAGTETVDDEKVIPFVASLLKDGIITDGMTTKALRLALNEVDPDNAPAKKGRKALKAGKAGDETQEKASASDVDVTEIDRLAEMSIDAKAGVVLNALQTVDTVIASMPIDGLDEEVKTLYTQSIEFLRDMVRSLVK